MALVDRSDVDYSSGLCFPLIQTLHSFVVVIASLVYRGVGIMKRRRATNLAYVCES